MRFGVLGTGRVGQTLATKLVELGHEVMMGSRSRDNENAVAWAASAGDAGSNGTFADAAAFGEVLVNAVSGDGTLPALEAATADAIAGKVLIDVANPLDFSRGMPPSLTVSNEDSLAEQIQRAFPATKVVKTLNTVSAPVMVAPEIVPGEHVLFVSGDAADAKNIVVELLQSFGWPAGSIIDLGDITTARGPEMFLSLWVRLMLKQGTPIFNIGVQTG
jgi:8-hydroxy-5-deazaflavin:NADPH oxidoreductase